VDEAFSAARDAVLALCRGGMRPVPDDVFDDIARRVFRYQLDHDPALAAYARRRGVTGDVSHWTKIPGVPTAAFKELALAGGAPDRAEAVFRTSGTTRGSQGRGAHYVRDLGLYRASLLPTFEAFVLPDGAQPRMLSLIPRPSDAPDSSLSYMVGAVMDAFAADGSGWFAGPAGLDTAGLEAALAQPDGPVCLLATSAAFIHWLDDLADRGRSLRLPDGSRLMDTGGFKGRGRVVPAETLRAEYERRLGIPGVACVNEYGMTEMLSQFYDSTLRDSLHGGSPSVSGRRKLGPPWVRTVVVDAETLEPVPEGAVGLLCHYDLANVGSALAVQTEDIGRAQDDGFVLLGRAAGASPRGCSLAMDQLLRAVEGP
jgi:hypothetical protein